MATITFSNGKVVQFNGTPTTADINEVAQSIGAGSVTDPNTPQSTSSSAPAAPKKDLLSTAADDLTSLFPGTKTIGNSLGTAAVGVGQLLGLVPGGVKGFNETAKTAPTVPQLAGAYTAAGATAISPEADGIGANAAIGALEGGGNAIANGESIPKAAESAGEGAALYGGATAVGGLIGKAATYLPTRITQKALAGATPETAEYALKNTKIGSIKSLLDDSKQATQSGSNQIEAALDHPDNIGKVVNGTNIYDSAMKGNPAIPNSGLPNSTYTQPQIANIVRKLVPNQGGLVDKLFNSTGDQTLTIKEANTLRSKLDDAVKAVYINGQKVDSPALSANKVVGAQVAGAIRNDVKSQAPETVPMFQKLQQEINLRNALAKTSNKLDKRAPVGLYDILSGIGGLTAGGPVGAGAAYLTEKALRSPALNIAAAKGIKTVAPAIGRTAVVAGKAAAPAIVNAFSK